MCQKQIPGKSAGPTQDSSPVPAGNAGLQPRPPALPEAPRVQQNPTGMLQRDYQGPMERRALTPDELRSTSDGEK
jgi:hypothetical protein